MPLRAIEVFKKLDAEDINFLARLERGTKRYEYIPTDRLTVITKIQPKKLQYLLGKANKLKLIEGRTDKYRGYKILPAGYDVLALWSLVQKNVIEAFGNKLGVGKEADVYNALQPDGSRVAVKFNRLGRTSFTRVKRTRTLETNKVWIEVSKKAAEREFKVLKKLYPEVSVPKPVAINRHVLVTGLIDGDELGKVSEISEPETVLDDVLDNIKIAYSKGVIHADLSEHNVLVKPDGRVLLIDWPQWIQTSNENAEELLERDLRNILKFFNRRFGLEKELEKLLEDC